MIPQRARWAALCNQLSTGGASASGGEASRPRPVALLIFDMQPEQEAEGMVEKQWLPAAGAIERTATIAVASTPEEVTRQLAGGLRPEIVFLFCETGWGYEALLQHKATLLAGGLRWVQAASSGAEKLCPIWLGTDVTCAYSAQQ